MSVSYDLSGKNVIVTGASQGIGKVVVEHFVKSGANVALVSRNKENLDKVIKDFDFAKGKLIAVSCDVSKPDDVENMAKTVEKEFGTVDVLVNNAGINKHGPALDMSYETWCDVLSVNLTSVFLVSKAIGAMMVKAKSGSIINVASMSGSIINRPQPQCVYNASKAGVIHLTKSLAMEWVDYGVRVNSVSPGYTVTEMSVNVPKEWNDVWMETTPMKRMASPDEIATAILYLADEASSYSTGSDIIIDGGFTAW